MSLSDLAASAGVSKSHLSVIENGTGARPGAAILHKVAVALGVTSPTSSDARYASSAYGDTGIVAGIREGPAAAAGRRRHAGIHRVPRRAAANSRALVTYIHRYHDKRLPRPGRMRARTPAGKRSASRYVAAVVEAGTGLSKGPRLRRPPRRLHHPPLRPHPRQPRPQPHIRRRRLAHLTYFGGG
jgi:transcriptional regulator with XRE-family HTH domain